MEPREGKASGSLGPESVYTRLQRIADLARRSPEMVLTTLAHHIDMEFLREAHRLTRKDGAVGVDGQSAEEYAANLEGNLRGLLERFKSGEYRAPPVKRAYIPKVDGKERPIGMPAFEDKVLQRAVAMVLEAVYEQDFLDCSYGFRPGRSAHQALGALRSGLMEMDGGWVVEVDIRSFFDTLDHGHLRAFLDKRVRDGVLRRTVGKWLKAGVLEAGVVSYPEAGTPQGGVISPLLANIYLHEVMDRWFRDEVQPRLRGRSFMVRYADDLVVVCEREDDARRVLEVLPKRFGKYGLTLHPEKTRLVNYRSPRRGGEGPRPGSFDFLGFNHHWAKSRRGYWVVKRSTSRSRLGRAVQAVGLWLRKHRHDPVEVQQVSLGRKMLGHYAYYGITGNAGSLRSFYHQVTRAWRQWLNRRSYRARLNWEAFQRLLERHPLPRARVVHSVYRYAANP